MIYLGQFPEEEEDNISLFMVKLKERLDFLFKDIMDEYAKVNETHYGTGIGFSCEVDGVWARDLRLPFTGSWEFETDKVACWLDEKYANLFDVELVAKDVKVRKLAWVKRKCDMEN